MAAKKSTTTEQTTSVATPEVVAPATSVAEKQKRTKKSENAATTATSTSTTSSTSTASKRSKKVESSETSAQVVEPSTSEKPKKVSKKRLQPESSEQSVETSTPSSETPVSESGAPEKKRLKRVSKKNFEEDAKEVFAQTSSSSSEQDPQPVSESVGETSAPVQEGTEQSVEKRVRKVVTQDTLKTDVEQLRQQVESEMVRLRSDQQKNKGVKFLKVVNKSLKNLTTDLNRVLKSKTKTVRNKNNSSGFMKPVRISSEMASFTNWDPSQLYSRNNVTKFICNYIREKDLQNPQDRRQILCDDKLASLLKIDRDTQVVTYPGIQKYMQHHFVSNNSTVSEEVAHP
jgi:chromatin remodeling complex protein RSC6